MNSDCESVGVLPVKISKLNNNRGKSAFKQKLSQITENVLVKLEKFFSASEESEDSAQL